MDTGWIILRFEAALEAALAEINANPRSELSDKITATEIRTKLHYVLHPDRTDRESPQAAQQSQDWNEGLDL